MSLLSQLVDPQVLVRLDQADFARLEALTTGTVLRDAESRRKLESSVDTLIKTMPKETIPK